MRPRDSLSFVTFGIFLAISTCYGKHSYAQTKPENGKHVKACCVITAVDPRTGSVTVREAASGCTFQFKIKETSNLNTFKPGQEVDKGQGASSTTSCGSNVGRNENTKTAPCRVYTQDHGWVPCK